jgi:hypothetical protein
LAKEELKAHMLGLKRRAKAEGWQQEVSEPELDGEPTSLRQRLGDSDKLWLVSLVIVVLIVVISVAITRRGGEGLDAAAKARSAGVGRYDDAAHNAFVEALLGNTRYSRLMVESRFDGPNTFRITVHSDASGDEVADLARYVGNGILAKFKMRVVVHVYARSAATGNEKLVATARYEDEEFGYIVEWKERRADTGHNASA